MNKKEIKNYKCQIFTPDDYVTKLLDLVGYKQNVFNRTFLENSCGDGNVLTAVVKLYIEEGKKLKYTNEQIGISLSKNIYGFEIDVDHYNKCIERLNDITSKEGIYNVDWKIYCKDFLKSKLDMKFDYVVGNPPYITYRKLSVADRCYLNTNFETCKQGKFDYCYAFIEKSINLLSDAGKMSYLIPNTVFKTVFGQSLRDFIKPYIYQINDYTKDKIFDNALVKSSILVIDKTINNRNIIYVDESNKQTTKISKDNLKGKWVFSKNKNIGNRRFGDFFTVSHVVATLLNEAFVISDYIEEEEHYVVNGKLIEKEMVKDTTTVRTKRSGKQEKIIFPYSYDKKGNLIRYSEKEFKIKYKETYKYLLSFKDRLDTRASDKNIAWFEYGRSQALNSIHCDKLLVSLVITDRAKVQLINNNTIPYAGVFITVNKNNNQYDLKDAKEILESDDFIDYVHNIGINISGSSLRVTSKDIENFIF